MAICPLLALAAVGFAITEKARGLTAAESNLAAPEQPLKAPIRQPVAEAAIPAPAAVEEIVLSVPVTNIAQRGNDRASSYNNVERTSRPTNRHSRRRDKASLMSTAGQR